MNEGTICLYTLETLQEFRRFRDNFIELTELVTDPFNLKGFKPCFSPNDIAEL